MYAAFTNCPLNNPLMHEVTILACVAGHATSGSITIGNITTPVTSPVNVQFGFGFTPSSDNYPAPVYPPLAGDSAILSTGPDLIPGSLTSILGCPSSDATVQNICQQASANPADNQVYALAQEVGDLRDFMLFNWTQAVKFKLINPLLGSNCSIGTDGYPVVLHPQLSIGPGGTIFIENDPAPTVHPDVAVLGIQGAVASDTTFAAPGAFGCGPGGADNLSVNQALDTGSGLPAASGNSLTLNGTFLLGVSEGGIDSSLPQPYDNAAGLLAAFKASTNGEHSVKHLVTQSQAESILHLH
jgi:hypothetical protein